VIRYFSFAVFAPLLVAGWTQSALGGEWDISVGLGVEETFSDNANLAADNADRNSDFITSITPDLSIRGSGGRMSLNLDYSLARLIHKNGTSDDTTINTLSAAGNIEIWKRVAFVDATASLSRQVIDSGGAVSSTAAGQTQNRSNVRSFDVSPYFLHQFGTWVETESRTRFSKVTNSSGTTSDNTTRQTTIRINGGRRFQRFGWAVTFDRLKEARDGDTPTRRTRNVDADFTFAINRKFSLLSGVGFEDVEDGTLNNQPEGLTWNAGFLFTPSGRTSIRATYGRRFEERDISLDATHSLSRRTTITATFTETQSTSQSQINQDLSTFASAPTPGAPTIGNSNFDQQSDSFRQRSFTAGISGSRKRNTFNLNVNWESRKTDSTGFDQVVTGLDAGFGRQLSRRTTANFSTSLTRTDFGDTAGRIDNFLTVQGDLTYQIFETANAVLSFTRTQRRSNRDGNGQTENAVVVGLRKQF
jgi:uncharacterized protein (PEP-CTERM system associated)